MPKRKISPSEPRKPWRARVVRRQRKKSAKRRFWSRARWLKHHRQRGDRGAHRTTRRRMSLRLDAQRQQRLYAQRRARMIALNARRRILKCTNDETARNIVNAILENIGLIRELVRARTAGSEVAVGRQGNSCSPMA